MSFDLAGCCSWTRAQIPGLLELGPLDHRCLEVPSPHGRPQKPIASLGGYEFLSDRNYLRKSFGSGTVNEVAEKLRSELDAVGSWKLEVGCSQTTVTYVHLHVGVLCLATLHLHCCDGATWRWTCKWHWSSTRVEVKSAHSDAQLHSKAHRATQPLRRRATAVLQTSRAAAAWMRSTGRRGIGKWQIFMKMHSI